MLKYVLIVNGINGLPDPSNPVGEYIGRIEPRPTDILLIAGSIDVNFRVAARVLVTKNGNEDMYLLGEVIDPH